MARYQITVYDATGTVLASPEIAAPSANAAADYAKARLDVYRDATLVTVRRSVADIPFATFEKESAR